MVTKWDAGLEAKTFQSLAHRANGLWNLLAVVKFH